MTSAERRQHHRYRVHLAVQIDTEGRKDRVGISQDASIHGMLLNTRSQFDIGEELDLKIHLPVTEDEASVRGHVVRMQAVDGKSPLPFRYLAAIAFERPVHELEASLRAKAARAASPELN
jgi:hypothetical protein